jgi:hypothetical protein
MRLVSENDDSVVAGCEVSRLVPFVVGIAADENCGDSIIQLVTRFKRLVSLSHTVVSVVSHNSKCWQYPACKRNPSTIAKRPIYAKQKSQKYTYEAVDKTVGSVKPKSQVATPVIAPKQQVLPTKRCGS